MVSKEIDFDDEGRDVHMANVAPIQDERGQLLGSVVVLRDISRLKEIERIKSQFVRMVSHELRAPLGAIQGYLGLVLSSDVLRDRPDEAEMLDRARKRSDALLNLVDDLLNLSALEAGAVARHMEPLDLGGVASECVELMRVKAQERDVTISESVEDDLPAVLADRDDVSRAFTNLLSNAVKYNRDGGSIEVSIKRDGPYVRADVADTGIGIPDGALESLFSEFFRVKSPQTREITGTGLGLSIVKRTIEAYQGKVEVRSVLGEGSVFSFLLPAYEPGSQG
jgi:two-component system, OmpR family, phosphate regulon sensor histidine kinase PhoR